MTDNEMRFVRDLLDEITLLRNSIEQGKRLVDAEKGKTETANGLLEKSTNDTLKFRIAMSDLCLAVNSLAINDWSKVSPSKCKDFVIGLKQDIEACIKKHNIRFNAARMVEVK